MKFGNPFFGAMIKATRTATRKATQTMQKRAIAVAVSVIRQTIKSSMPKVAPKTRQIKDINRISKAGRKAVAPKMRPAAGSTADLVADFVTDQQDKGLPGQFVTRSLTNAAGTRAYKLYIPVAYTGKPLPLLVMLHGCTQDPDDFAAGTRMNDIAEKNGCFVVYPAQTRSANGQKCWNWFSAIDQQRDRGEASIIADITRAVIADYACDRGRIFVAGLSAGGAMAVIMGNRYPELYSAVGVHSGLPYAAARDLSSALAAMRDGAMKAVRANGHKALPVIVFHGDRDMTVHPRNGERIIAQALARSANTERMEQGEADDGHAYTRAIYDGGGRRPMAELWTLHGIAHAWSGGSAKGSYTHAGGPDASAEMMRFFTTGH